VRAERSAGKGRAKGERRKNSAGEEFFRSGVAFGEGQMRALGNNEHVLAK
jgi:hypothetical protein